MTNETLYMNVATGSVDTLDGWIDENTEGCTEAEINECIENGSLVEVVLVNGEYVEAE